MSYGYSELGSGTGKRDERKEEIYAATAAGPLTAFEVVGVLWPRLSTDQVYLGVCEVLGHVDLLVDEGRIAEVEEDGLVRLVRTSG